MSFWRGERAAFRPPAFSDGSCFSDSGKVPRDVSGAEAVKAFKRLGFVVVRQEGSHIRMSKERVHITIPNHKEIAPKTLQTMLRQAAVTFDEFRDAM